MITIFVLKGRIQVQGRLVKDWGNNEFKHMLDMFNSKGLMKTHNTFAFINKVIGKETQNSEQNYTNKNGRKATDSPQVMSFAMIKNYTNTIKEPRKTILLKNDETVLLKSTQASQQQAIFDLTIKEMELEEEMKVMRRDQKIYQDKNKMI